MPCIRVIRFGRFLIYTCTPPPFLLHAPDSGYGASSWCHLTAPLPDAFPGNQSVEQQPDRLGTTLGGKEPSQVELGHFRLHDSPKYLCATFSDAIFLNFKSSQ